MQNLRASEYSEKSASLPVVGGSRMTYDAIDIAKYIVQKFIDLGKPITHMKLQKLLYFSWMEYYKDYGEYLFKNEIYAWKFGPVIPEVYYKYSIFGGMPITPVRDTEGDPVKLGGKAEISINKIIDRYEDASAASLVNQTHEKDTPWDKACRKSKRTGKDIVIEFKDIIEACNDNNLPSAR